MDGNQTIPPHRPVKRVAFLLVCLLALGAAAPSPVAYDQDLPPFSEVADGEAQGMAVDVLRAAAAKAGLALTLSPVPFAQGPRTMQDGVAAAYFPLAITPERALLYDFSAPLVETGGALYVRAGEVPPETLAELDGAVLVTPGTGPLAAFIRRTAPRVDLQITKDYEESLDRLVHGQAKAAALNDVVGGRIAARLYPGQVVRSKGRFLTLPLAVAVPKGQGAALLAQVNAGLAAIRADGIWQSIADRWSKP